MIDREILYRSSENLNELFAALAKAQSEFESAPKAGANPHFKSRYATLESVMDATKKGRENNGLAVIQMPGNSDGTNIAVTTILGHSSGQWIESTFAVAPSKFDAQGAGSVVTYLRRYALMSVLGIAPQDDDGEAAVAAPTRAAAAPAPHNFGAGRDYRPANPPPTRNATSYIHDAPPPDHQGRTVNSIRDEAQAALVDAKSIARVNEIKAMYKDTLAEIDKIKPAVSNNLRILAETRIKELAAAEHRAKELTNPRMPEEDQYVDHRI